MKKKSITLLSLGLLTILVGCNNTPTSEVISSATSVSSSEAASSLVSSTVSSESESASASASSSSATDIITQANLQKAQTTYKKADGTTADLNRNTLYNNSKSPHLNPSGEQHVFVAPLCFTKDPSDSNDNIIADDALLEKIDTTFSADTSTMQAKGGLYSVSDFYTRSSYGKANFSATVMPTWIQYEGTAKQFRSANANGGVDAAEYCRTWYVSEYAKEGHGALGVDAKPITYFDADNDGFIDLMWVVYAYPYFDTDYWWAYVTYTGNSAGPVGPQGSQNPNVKTLGWASTNFMTKSFNGYDSHTFIHETGHTFGLDDYYDYTSTWAPMAGVDYMDHNLGDHNAFSKFSLGWAQPYVLKEEDLEGGKTALIDLNAFTNSGDCLVLASPNYNNTAFDEYFMLELVGPTGLAEKDYKNGYENTTGFTAPGIRITHVDARVWGSSSVTHDQYFTDADAIGSSARFMRLTNTYGGRSGLQSDGDYFPVGNDKNYMTQLSLMESTIDSSNNWTKTSTYNATNNSLFTKGQRFTLSDRYSWGKTYMPSRTNLWNKAKTTTGWASTSVQTYTIDDTVTCNFSVRVMDIKEDPTYGYTSQVRITLN